MKATMLVILVCSTAVWIFIQLACVKTQENMAPVKHVEVSVVGDCPGVTSPFPSYADKYGPPDWWCTGNKRDPENYPIFELSQDYPSKSYDEFLKNECTDCPWQVIDFKTSPRGYLQEIIKYAFEGNLEVGWIVQRNAKRKWYHTPYMHLDIVDPNKPSEVVEKVAREFTHGLTMERPGCLSELVYEAKNSKNCSYPPKDPEKDFQSWAISFYNERGASYIGRVWDEMRNPLSTAEWPAIPQTGFPEGTVAVKLLFTEAPVSRVSYLAGSPTWDADTADLVSEGTATKRMKEMEVVQKDICKNDPKYCRHTLRLLQVDLAVRDKNARQTGWVFSTFTYDSKSKGFIRYAFPPGMPQNQREKLSAWLRIEPLGIIFGNDPDVPIGGDLEETQQNTALTIPQHYGCGAPDNPQKRRLNGPVDNPISSCIACHALSETPQNLQVDTVPYDKMSCVSSSMSTWFKNINPRGSNPTHTPSAPALQMLSLDYSLQLREGVRRYCVESYQVANVCRVSYKSGQSYTAITKEGIKSFSVQ